MDFKVQVLNTEDTISKLVTLIREARERVTLVSPYVTLGAEDRIGRAVHEALSRGVEVNLVIRVDKQTEFRESLAEILRPHLAKGLKLYVVPGLHAKLYRSESTVIFTSLNLLASSFLNTIEVGLWSQDPQAVLAAATFLKNEIFPSTTLVGLRGDAVAVSKGSRAERPERTSKPKAGDGHCIECGDAIPMNPSRPYCPRDYSDWKDNGEDKDEEGDFCHLCGDDHPATMRKPLCGDCYALVR